VIVTELRGETDLGTQTLCCNGLVGPFSSKNGYHVLGLKSLSGLMKIGDSQNEVYIRTPKYENLVWHRLLLKVNLSTIPA
jgi:hypothetical protein